MLDPSVHSRQFVLGPDPVSARPEWSSLYLDDGLCLSHCPKLRIASITDARRRRWLLLGSAVQIDPNRPAPEEALRNSAAADVSTLYQSWTGRWLLIGDGTIHLDADGSLGCFYRSSPDEGPGKRLWVSSSLPLLAKLPGVEAPPGQPRRLMIGDGFGWDPPPGTGYRGIRKLLPTQVLETASGRVRLRPIELRAAQSLTYDQILDRLAECLVTAIKNVQGRIHLALSAGYDSRLLLAAAQVAGVPFSTYTQTFPTMLAADRTLPPLLARLVGAEHRLIAPARKEQALLEAFDEHCGGQSVDADRTFFACKQWHWTEPGDILLQGGGFELGKCFYWTQLPADPPPVESLLRSFGAARCPHYVRDSLSDYMDWIDSAPIDGLDWRDRFYLEVRLGGWGSANQQALDIVNGRRFMPANSALVFALLLAVPEEKRRRLQHQIDLIERLAPELLRYPFNEPDGLVRLTRRRMRSYGSLLRERGLATTFYQFETAMKRRLKRRATSHGAGTRRH